MAVLARLGTVMIAMLPVIWMGGSGAVAHAADCPRVANVAEAQQKIQAIDGYIAELEPDLRYNEDLLREVQAGRGTADPARGQQIIARQKAEIADARACRQVYVQVLAQGEQAGRQRTIEDARRVAEQEARRTADKAKDADVDLLKQVPLFLPPPPLPGRAIVPDGEVPLPDGLRLTGAVTDVAADGTRIVRGACTQMPGLGCVPIEAGAKLSPSAEIRFDAGVQASLSLDGRPATIVAHSGLSFTQSDLAAQLAGSPTGSGMVGLARASGARDASVLDLRAGQAEMSLFQALEKKADNLILNTQLATARVSQYVRGSDEESGGALQSVRQFYEKTRAIIRGEETILDIGKIAVGNPDGAVRPLPRLFSPEAQVNSKGTGYTVERTVSGDVQRTTVTVARGSVVMRDRVTGAEQTVAAGGSGSVEHRVLLRDDFQNVDAGLLPNASSDPSRHLRGYADGEYFIRQVDPAIATVWLAGPSQRLPDALLAVDARVEGEPAGQIIYIYCRTSGTGDTFVGYRLGVTPAAGTFTLRRYDPKGTNVILAGPAESSAIARGNDVNRMALGCAGRTISAEINGELVAAVQDGTYKEGLFSVGTARGAAGVLPDARFDNLVVLAAGATCPVLDTVPLAAVRAARDLKDESALRACAASTNKSILEGVGANVKSPPDVLLSLTTTEKAVAWDEVAGNPSSPPDALRILAQSPDSWVRSRVANNPSAPDDVLSVWVAKTNGPCLPIEDLDQPAAGCNGSIREHPRVRKSGGKWVLLPNTGR